ncbi:hypothetical protein ABKN59_003008 [Abortiporus biennis]
MAFFKEEPSVNVTSRSEALPNLDTSLGAVLVGLLVTSMLYGITCVQTYIYYTGTGKRDKISLRGIVAFLWVLDGLQLVFLAHLMYHYLISNHHNPIALNTTPWSASGFNIPTNLNDVTTRAIFIYRIWKLGKNMSLTIGLTIMNFVCSAFGFAMTAKLRQLNSFQRLPEIQWLIYCVFGSIAFIDTAIAATLCILLWRMQTGFAKTDSELQKLIKYSIHTGSLTSFVAISALVSYGIMSHNLVYIAIYTTLPKFYLNALLATLNARRAIGSQLGQKSEVFSFIPLTPQDRPECEPSKSIVDKVEPISILITSNTEVHRDTGLQHSDLEHY